MTADDFEKAILLDPADDVRRLVYADWLDETGDPADAARAEYIRLQCEAATLSDLDHRRHFLERRASLLFREHWVDWWRPVCRRVKLPEPFVDDGSILASVKRIVRGERAAGWPYRCVQDADGDFVVWNFSQSSQRPTGYAAFTRGFVDELNLTREGRGGRGPTVADWLAAVPAVGLVLAGDSAAGNTPALRSIRKLSIDITGYQSPAPCLLSPHLTVLEELELVTSSQGVTVPVLRAIADAPLGAQVRRLTLGISTVSAVTILVDASRFARLRDLTVTVEPSSTGQYDSPDDWDSTTYCVTPLAELRSRLERLSLFTHGDLPPAGFRELTRRPWERLRTLELLDPLLPEDVRALSADAFPHLAELLLVLEPAAANETLDVLAAWPAVKRLTRLCFGGGTAKADPERLTKLAASLDLDALRTFHLEPHADPTLKDRLSAMLGDRLWVG